MFKGVIYWIFRIVNRRPKLSLDAALIIPLIISNYLLRLTLNISLIIPLIISNYLLRLTLNISLIIPKLFLTDYINYSLRFIC